MQDEQVSTRHLTSAHTRLGGENYCNPLALCEMTTQAPPLLQQLGAMPTSNPKCHWNVSWKKPWGWELDVFEGRRGVRPLKNKGTGINVHIKLDNGFPWPPESVRTLRRAYVTSTLRVSGLPNAPCEVSRSHELWSGSERPGPPMGSSKLIFTQQEPHCPSSHQPGK